MPIALQTHYCKYILFHLTFYTRRLRPSNQRWRRPQQRHLLCRAVTRSTRTLTDADANGSTFTENRIRTENSFDRFFFFFFRLHWIGAQKVQGDDGGGDSGAHCTKRWKKSLLVTHTKWLSLNAHPQSHTTQVLCCNFTYSSRQQSRTRTDHHHHQQRQREETSVCQESGIPTTSWSVKLWVTIYHLLGFTCFSLP